MATVPKSLELESRVMLFADAAARVAVPVTTSEPLSEIAPLAVSDSVAAVLAPATSVDYQKLCAGEAVPVPVPQMVTSWCFRGVSRFDSIISGGLSRGEVTVDANALWHTSDALACMGLDADYRGPHPISGGSDAPIEVVPGGRGLSRPGDAEQHRGAPRLRRGAPSAGGLGGPFEAPHV